jgi:hypothetical protein
MFDSKCSRCSKEGLATIELDFGDGKGAMCLQCLSGKAISLYGQLLKAAESLKKAQDDLDEKQAQYIKLAETLRPKGTEEWKPPVEEGHAE